MQLGVYMGWVNPTNPVKPIQIDPKKWVGLGWVRPLGKHDFQKLKIIQNNWVMGKPTPNQQNPWVIECQYFRYFL